MGSGGWSSNSFRDYTLKTKKAKVTSTGSIDFKEGIDYQDIYRSTSLNSALNPKDVIRECCDSTEHPNTVPVILALDVTGSMDSAAIEVAKQLNVIMTDLYKTHKDIEFMVMGIGDLAYDDAPIQASQFESDIRIAEQLDKIYFEGAGGGNNFESYTAAWYFGVYCTKLDCWKRHKKGIIITIGDETLNPYLPGIGLKESLGEAVEFQQVSCNIETPDLYEEAKLRFDLFHIHVNHNLASSIRSAEALEDWRNMIGKDNVAEEKVNGIAQRIVTFIDTSIASQDLPSVSANNQSDSITWTETSSESTPIGESFINNCITW